MKKIFYNEDNLNEKDINNSVKRAKMLIINSNNEILLGYGHNTYQLIGGHIEDNESYDECIVREVKEETGITIPLKERYPFLQIKYYCKDYPKERLNSEYIINYYSIISDLKPNIDIINLTDNEKEGLFEFRYIHLDEVIDELKSNLEICKNKNTVNDTIEAIKIYLEENNIKN